MQEEDAFVGAVTLGGGAEEIDELHEGEVEAEDGVGAVVEGIAEEGVADGFFLEDLVAFAALAHDGVVETLVGVAHNARLLGADVQIFPEGA